MWRLLGRGKVLTGFWWGNLRESNDLEDPRVDSMIILRWNFRKWVGGVWTVLMWLRRWLGSGHF